MSCADEERSELVAYKAGVEVLQTKVKDWEANEVNTIAVIATGIENTVDPRQYDESTNACSLATGTNVV